jgi:hypothetical protein
MPSMTGSATESSSMLIASSAKLAHRVNRIGRSGYNHEGAPTPTEGWRSFRCHWRR